MKDVEKDKLSMYALWWIVKEQADKLELSDEDIERIKRKLKKKLEIKKFRKK